MVTCRLLQLMSLVCRVSLGCFVSQIYTSLSCLTHIQTSLTDKTTFDQAVGEIYNALTHSFEMNYLRVHVNFGKRETNFQKYHS